MHASTCATFLISVHPVISHLRDKSFDEQTHQSWLMVGKTSVLRPRRDAFFIDSHRKQTKHSYLQWKLKILCTCTQAKHPFPSPQHTCVHAQTHIVLVCGCVQRLSAAGDSPHKGTEQKGSCVIL